MAGLLDLLTGAARDPADCVVRIGTPPQEISDLYPFLAEVTAECSRTMAWAARLTFRSTRDERGSWRVQDDPRIAPWQPVQIAARFGRMDEDVLTGYVREVRAEYPNDAGRAGVTVECQDVSLKLDREHVRKTWGDSTPTTDTAIVTELLTKHGLVPVQPPAGGRKGVRVNQDATDARFLRERAEASGLELQFPEGRVYFGPMRLTARAQATIVVYGGPATNCLSFSAKVDGHQPEKVAFDLADAGTGGSREVVVGPSLAPLGPRDPMSAGTGLKPFVWRMTREGSADEDELKAKAQRKADELSLRIRAEGELDGALYGHVLRAGEPVGVDGVGDELSGTWYVDTVAHRFSPDGYRQRFTLLRNRLGDNLTAPANPLRGVV